jgi:hypothetical protein
MKLSLSFFLALLPAIATAADNQSMSQEDMQRMMQQAQKAALCMQNIGEDDMKKLEQRGYQFETEVRALCDSGKRVEAQKKAIEFAKDFENDPAMVQMKKCGEGLESMMPKMAIANQDNDDSAHVCDEL